MCSSDLIAKLPAQIQDRLGMAEIPVDATSTIDLAKKIAQQYPEIASYLINSRGDVRDSLIFYIGNKVINKTEQLPDGAVVEMLFAISGGSI